MYVFNILSKFCNLDYCPFFKKVCAEHRFNCGQVLEPLHCVMPHIVFLQRGALLSCCEIPGNVAQSVMKCHYHEGSGVCMFLEIILIILPPLQRYFLCLHCY